MDVHGAIGVDGGGLAAEGGDFAEEADGLVGEGVEVLGVDAGGCFGGHGLGGLDGVGGGIVLMLWNVGGRGGGGARKHVIMMLNMPSLDGF